MKIKKEKFIEIATLLDDVIHAVLQEEKSNGELLDKVAKEYLESARNLIHYRAFRRFDLRSTQKKLRNIGLSRFANAEGHILASLSISRYILQNLAKIDSDNYAKPRLSIKKGKRLLTKNTKALLGYRSKGRRVRIMVTQPTESAHNYALVQEMVQNGMNCARINCAHDSPEVWTKIIAHVKKAAKSAGRNVKIAMDLAGPKIRTGKMADGPKIRKFSPERDVTGKIIRPAAIVLIDKVGELSPENSLPIGQEVLSALNHGDSFDLTDCRGKKCSITIVAGDTRELIAHCSDTSYIGTGTTLQCTNRTLETITVGELPPIEQHIVLRKNDVLTITRDNKEGVPALIDEAGQLIQKGRISCQLPEVFDYIHQGDRVLFDDGKIEGIISELRDGEFDVNITLAKENGTKLKSEKGINFPDSRLGISGLTKKDKEDLVFIAEYADIVNFSFVNSKEDVAELHEELKKHGVYNKLDVILKIETAYAAANLTEILLSAMQSKFVGVMIARGDLAVEVGWDNMGKVQQELLMLCSAAHIPVIWATQVLENLAKKGLPSRSEITDATAAIQAECIMLNKGPFINRAITLLDTILSDLEHTHEKKEVMLPKL